MNTILLIRHVLLLQVRPRYRTRRNQNATVRRARTRVCRTNRPIWGVQLLALWRRRRSDVVR